MGKVCTLCYIEKTNEEFNNKKDSKDKLTTWCKQCTCEKSLAYKRTKDGIVSALWAIQKRNSLERKMNLPTYSREELREWLFSQSLFHLLYDNWKRLDYQPDYKPSVDRKDDYISYTMSNIQLMTWGENREKAQSDIENGINRKYLKAVSQFTKNGEYLKSFYSINEASRQTGVKDTNISRVCRDIRKSAGGFKWKYQTEEEF